MKARRKERKRANIKFLFLEPNKNDETPALLRHGLTDKSTYEK
jgi:hypothetical protein